MGGKGGNVQRRTLVTPVSGGGVGLPTSSVRGGRGSGPGSYPYVVRLPCFTLPNKIWWCCVADVEAVSDLQKLEVTVEVATHPDPDELVKLFTTLGTDYAHRLLPALVNESLKVAVAARLESDIVDAPQSIERDVQVCPLLSIVEPVRHV